LAQSEPKAARAAAAGSLTFVNGQLAAPRLLFSARLLGQRVMACQGQSHIDASRCHPGVATFLDQPSHNTNELMTLFKSFRLQTFCKSSPLQKLAKNFLKKSYFGLHSVVLFTPPNCHSCSRDVKIFPH
jgi:hypothetical protein